MESEQVVAGGHSRAAIDDGLLALGSQRRVVRAQRLGRAEDGDGLAREVLGEGRAPGAGDVAGAGVDGLDLPAVALRGPRIEDEPGRRQRPSSRPCRAPTPPAGAGRSPADAGDGTMPSMGRPSAIHLTMPAVEDGDVVVAVGSQEIPQARGHGARPGRHRPRRSVPAPMPAPPIDAGDLLGSRPRMAAEGPPAAAAGRRQVGIDVEEHRARDVSGARRRRDPSSPDRGTSEDRRSAGRRRRDATPASRWRRARPTTSVFCSAFAIGESTLVYPAGIAKAEAGMAPFLISVISVVVVLVFPMKLHVVPSRRAGIPSSP